MSQEPERQTEPSEAVDGAPALTEPGGSTSSEGLPSSEGSASSEGTGTNSRPAPPRPSKPAPALEPLAPIRVMRVIAIGREPDDAEAPEIESHLEDDDSFDHELGEEEFEELDATPTLSEDDLLESRSEEPPPVAELNAAPAPSEAAAPSSPAFLESAPASEPAEAQPVVAANPSALEELEAFEDVTPAPPIEKRPPPPAPRSGRPVLPSAKPRRKPWWEEAFGDDFSRAYKPFTEAQIAAEAEFMVRTLELPKGAVLLDLCCGQGQHAVELSRRGFPVVGYDLSVYQLAMAADWAQTARQKINFLQGDMREMAFDSMFDAVISWDTSFGYFEEEKNLDVARRIFSALKPGGSLLLDVMNRDYAARETPNNQWFEGDGCICMDDMSLDWITSRLKVKRSVILDDGRSKELTYSIRLYNLSEIGKLLHDVGFRVLSVSGHASTPGAFLGSRSPRIIIRAQRPV